MLKRFTNVKYLQPHHRGGGVPEGLNCRMTEAMPTGQHGHLLIAGPVVFGAFCLDLFVWRSCRWGRQKIYLEDILLRHARLTCYFPMTGDGLARIIQGNSDQIYWSSSSSSAAPLLLTWGFPVKWECLPWFWDETPVYLIIIIIIIILSYNYYRLITTTINYCCNICIKDGVTMLHHLNWNNHTHNYECLTWNLKKKNVLLT